MNFIKRIVTVVALVYMLLALLMLFFPSVRESTGSIFGLYSLPLEVNLLLGLTWFGVAVVGLLLVFENLDSGLLRRNVTQQDRKINELKAQLFDAQKAAGVPTTGPAPAYPTTYDAPSADTPTTY
ncbi:MAG: hypothetical protein ACRYFX_20190 [Janthinobacterium lividum]